MKWFRRESDYFWVRAALQESHAGRDALLTATETVRSPSLGACDMPNRSVSAVTAMEMLKGASTHPQLIRQLIRANSVVAYSDRGASTYLYNIVCACVGDDWLRCRACCVGDTARVLFGRSLTRGQPEGGQRDAAI